MALGRTFLSRSQILALPVLLAGLVGFATGESLAGITYGTDTSASPVMAAGLVAVSLVLPAFLAGIAWWGHRVRRDEEQLDSRSPVDPLTGTAPRSAFIHRLDRLTRLGEAVEAGLGVMFIDIRRFSEINRDWGTEAADHVLLVIADRLKTSDRAVGMLARLGGDQFALLIEDGDAKTAGARAECTLDLIRQPINWHDKALRVSANIGLALAPHHGRDRSSLMKHADLALQHAKALGSDRIAVFSPESGEHFEARRALERMVLEAIEDKGFELYYQPVIDIQSSRIAGLEALLRLTGKDGRHVSPAEFVPVIERTGHIDEVGRWIIARACSFACHWPDGIKLAVNLSPLQFSSGDLPDDVAMILDETGCPAGRLELEVTENLVLDRYEHVRQQLARLQRMGIAIVLDDFGTGYSSLSYLCQFSFDKIKIDQEFIRDSDRSPRARGILRTIAALARRFDMEVTAEGVETAAHAELVRGLRFAYAQGYLYSRPVPEAEVADLFMRDYARQVAEEVLKLPAHRPHLTVVGK